jgi:hypothetical protein
MSDATVRAALEAVEAWLQETKEAPDPTFLETWNQTFQAAVSGAERGPDWAELVAWAHRLAPRVEQCRKAWEERRDAVRQELGFQAQGHRALKGYGANTR